MDRVAFLARIAERPLVGDGGMGTALFDRGAAQDACLDLLNVDRPDMVEDVHRSFADAGADFVETNTFGAGRFHLATHGLQSRVADINRAGVEVARRAGVLVAGSVGPLRVRLAPYGRVKASVARDAYREQIEALSGADFIVIETQSDLVEAEQALLAAREACDLPVVVMTTFTRDDRTLLGSTPANVARTLRELGADVVGVNCSEGPAQVLRIVEAMHAELGPDVFLAAMPNAGGPQRSGSRIVYPATSEYFGEYARAFLAAGVGVIGGCCGTGPSHVRALCDAVAEPRQRLDVLPREPEAEAVRTGEAPMTDLASGLASGRFVVAAEMDPPKGISTARLMAGAETLREAGADVIAVGDMPGARMRMSAWAVCRLISEHTGLETVLNFPTRGRNLLRVQGDLLAAHALGIRNLFVCMGDPTEVGNYPDATDNVDIVPTGLIRLLKESFNQGRDQAGESIGEPARFVVGCAVNLGADDLDREARLLRKKIGNGADFAFSQAVFDPDVLRTFRKLYQERYGELALPILAGIIPLVTSRHAEFLHNELPGITVPDAIRDRMRKASDPEAVGLDVARELAVQLRDEASGLFVMPPFGRYDIGAEVVEVAVRSP